MIEKIECRIFGFVDIENCHDCKIGISKCPTIWPEEFGNKYIEKYKEEIQNSWNKLILKIEKACNI